MLGEIAEFGEGGFSFTFSILRQFFSIRTFWQSVKHGKRLATIRDFTEIKSSFSFININYVIISVQLWFQHGHMVALSLVIVLISLNLY